MSLERYRGFIPDWDGFVDAIRRPEPTVLRVRRRRIPPADLTDRLRRQGFVTAPIEGMPDFLRVESGPFPASFTTEHWDGLFYVQQASTGVAAPVLAPKPGDGVLDLCAAPGGKTTHLAELMGDRGCVVASDVSEGRLRGLLGNVYRLGLPNIVVVAADAREFPPGARFDKVLVDAPCSGQGTLRRHGGRLPRQKASFLRYVTRAQDRILRRAIALTRPGGEILYVTCTFAPEENEAVVDRVLKDAPVAMEPLHLPVPHAPGLTSFEGSVYHASLEGAARIYPHHFDSGGLFMARLRRLDDAAAGSDLRARDSAWTPVPPVYPSRDDVDEVRSTLDGWLERFAGPFAVDAAVVDSLGWLTRGRTAWAHTVDAWPVEAWTPGGAWRLVSTGLRALEPAGGGWPRPTNDFLRMLGPAVRARRVAVGRDDLLRLLEGEVLPADPELRGYVALEVDADIVGRGSARHGELRSELSRARAAALRDCLAVGG